jgi:glucose/arabinose dehydrogenase
MPQLRLALALAVTATILGTPPAGAATLPPGFNDELVATVGAPTALAFTPDERVLITTQPGQLRVVRNGSLLPTPALDLTASICANSERGLLGVAVDPQFTSNHFIYLYYTWKKFDACPSNTSTTPVNRVSRFVLGDNDVVLPSTELVLIDNIHSPNGNHNGGDLNVGQDGNLYVSVGDGGCDYAGGGCAGANDASRDRNVLIGKVLRITRDGAIPAGNPFTGTGTARCSTTGSTTPNQICQETYAWGLRNPFRFAFDPNAAGTRWYVNDVGQNVWEEIDEGVAGADYGWNVREGNCANGSTTNCGPPPAGMTNPIYAYDHSSGCASITGGAFVPNGLWPAEYDGKYLFADYVCGSIFRLDPSVTGGYTRTAFATGLGGSSAVHLAFGPSPSGQSLYYTTYAGGGQVRRISHNGTPTAVLGATPTSGSAPLAVSFDGSGSSDPNGDALTYVWDFGDGSSTQTSSPTTTHTYGANATYTASLRVRDPGGLTSTPATVVIRVGNTPPAPTITSPAAGFTFAVGQTIALSGSATDLEDGALPASSLRWDVRLNHSGTHTHPLFTGTGNNLTFAAPAPEDVTAAANSFLEIDLTATDSGGLSSTVTRLVQPKKVTITLTTTPTGLTLTVNGVSVTGPTQITSWQGWLLALNAPSPQGKETFRSWSDGGAQSHSVVTPATSTTYTARFKRGKG